VNTVLLCMVMLSTIVCLLSSDVYEIRNDNDGIIKVYCRPNISQVTKERSVTRSGEVELQN